MSEPRPTEPTPAELQAWLHAQIPLSAAMRVGVQSLGPPELVLTAPLAPNRNHHGTAFGGSGVTLAILAGWAWVHVQLLRAGIDARLVIQRQTMEWDRGIGGDFEAAYSGAAPEEVARFLATVRQKGRARLALSVSVRCAGAECGRFTGDFVAARA